MLSRISHQHRNNAITQKLDILFFLLYDTSHRPSFLFCYDPYFVGHNKCKPFIIVYLKFSDIIEIFSLVDILVIDSNIFVFILFKI